MGIPNRTGFVVEGRVTIIHVSAMVKAVSIIHHPLIENGKNISRHAHFDYKRSYIGIELVVISVFIHQPESGKAAGRNPVVPTVGPKVRDRILQFKRISVSVELVVAFDSLLGPILFCNFLTRGSDVEFSL